MRILVFEDNLLWSSRLVHTLKALGHEPIVLKTAPDEIPLSAIAIVNLGSTQLEPHLLVPRLRSLGIHVIGHAGHKEKDILELGRIAGCDTIATNRELTFKIESILDRINGALDSSS